MPVWRYGIVMGVMWTGLCFTGKALAQQTIFNVPSADVTEPGVVYLEHETQTRPQAPNAYWVGTHYAAYGFNRHTELDVTLYNLSSPPSDNTALGMGFKSSWPVSHDQADIRLTAGTQLLAPLNGQGWGIWDYGHLSGRLPKLKTRLTAGLSAGSETLFGRDTVHFIGGIEQPVTHRLSLLADWFSGTHGLGLLTTGFSYTVPRWKTTFFLGCHIPNNRRVLSAPGITFELARFF